MCRKRHCERRWHVATSRLLKFMCWRRNSGMVGIVYLLRDQDKLPFYGRHVLTVARHGALTSEIAAARFWTAMALKFRSEGIWRLSAELQV
jgi:hypothetical protein